MRIAFHSNVHSVSHGGGGAYAAAIAACLAARHDVDFIVPAGADAAALCRLPEALLGIPSPARLRVVAAGAAALPELRAAWGDRRHDMVWRQGSHAPRLTLNRHAVLLCEFPFTRRLSPLNRLRVRSYRHVVANSAFTAGWIRRRWGRDATVLHPPIVPIAPAPVKKPWILGVGRFLGSRRSKRQLDMVRWFGALCRDGLQGWELHLAGFVQDPDYLEATRRAADGLPVHFHLNADRAALRDLYAVSSIFWHAVGEGLDPEREPELMEHFGIVTAEAMSAGCVPVVINRGGQPEIVGTDGTTGLLWDTGAACIRLTGELMADTSRCTALASAGAVRARMFALPAFQARLESLFPRL